MKTILRRHGSQSPTPLGPSAVTIGNFDGLHLGHRKLISEVVSEKHRLGKNAQAIVVSFYPHPGEVLGKANHLPRITTLHQKLDILSQWGIDVLYLIHFTKRFSKTSASAFIEEILLSSVGTESLLIGPDARIGHNKEGTPEFILKALAERGKSCRIISFLDADGAAISSRRIRALVEDGDVESASQLLGRFFAYRSRVIHGDHRGQSIGFPTANLYPNEQVVPKRGVYAGTLQLHQNTHNAVINVGQRPTFSGQDTRIEAHVLDYSGEPFYGATVNLEFRVRLRDEIKFAGVSELRAQIANDIQLARKYLSVKFSTL